MLSLGISYQSIWRHLNKRDVILYLLLYWFSSQLFHVFCSVSFLPSVQIFFHIVRCSKPSSHLQALIVSLLTALAEEARLILLVIASARTVKKNVSHAASTARTADLSLMQTPQN